MSDGKSFSLTDPGFVSTSLGEQIFQSLNSGADYREAFVEEKIRTGLAVQIKTIREKREGMTQTAFAKKLGKSQSWVSRLEDPTEPIPTVPTLLRIASTFDIGLQVKFVAFADLIDDVTTISPGTLDVPEFIRDPRLFPRKGASSQMTWRIMRDAIGGSGLISVLPPPSLVLLGDTGVRQIEETPIATGLPELRTGTR
jgi:transcriptional regulator with XRE-family HTH domain